MYSSNKLTFEFDCGTGSFDSSGNNKLRITDVKALAKVSYSGNYGGYQADVTLFGLGLELITILSSRGIGFATDLKVNIGMNIYANDTQIFSGMIFSSYANMNSIPESGLVINAFAGLDIARKSTKAYTFNGTTSLQNILKSICTPFGYEIITYGLDGLQGTNPHFEGSPLEQVRQVCFHFDLLMAINGTTITLWKRSNGINTIKALVSPDNGMIGYPVFTQSGIMYQTQFSPYLTAGQQVEIQTSLPNASGVYTNFAVDHYLSSWVKDGPWITMGQAGRLVTQGNTNE